jgi:hypothetical protein
LVGRLEDLVGVGCLKALSPLFATEFSFAEMGELRERAPLSELDIRATANLPADYQPL